ncbi:MAG: DUF115 domain-containing protein [Proteobacteria bacterium]|nr:DUF115 domain-containing protein [Pseudomonadota bacterium]MBU1638965.1 DUF115 domain-containing protein [Pseudomonadota bacterium]
MADLTELLRRAEMQQVNLQTEVQLQKNLAFFKQHQPALHNQFLKYTPENLRLLFTDDGYLNLVNYKLNNQPVYPENPIVHTQKALQGYKRQPIDFKCSAAKAPTLSTEKNAHLPSANKMVDILATQPQAQTKELPALVNFMVMLGVGLGYQLEGLLKETDIRHLCIIETQADVFYASMHTINWQPIFQHFSQEGYSLELIIGKDQDAYTMQFNAYLDKIGVFNTVSTFIFRHLTSPSLEESIRNYTSKILQMKINGAGFFDDEQVGLAHTISNTVNHTPILQDHSVLNKTYLNKPAFIVANGPSLDNAVEFLKTNQDKAIIFSCGTALGSLMKMGIKPDFHIEQERPLIMMEWIKSATTDEDRKDITLLALNPVHPKILSLFGRSAMGMKANDVGTHYLSQYVKPNKQMLIFGNCNPTVSNCGLAYASAFGFKEVYFFGLDLGFPEGERHHSTFSKHYEVKESEEHSLHILKPAAQNGLTAPGNFGGKVITNDLFMRSLSEIEMAIKINPGMHCFNTSNGVLIKGAQPLQVTELKLDTQAFDKRKYIDKIFKKYFSADLLKKFTIKEVGQVFEFALEALSSLEMIAQKPVHTIHQGIDMLASLHAYITNLAGDPKRKYAASLLKGSVTTFGIIMAQALCRTNDEEKNVSLYNQCLIQFFDFIKIAKEIVESDLLKEDTSTHNLQEKLTATP